MNICVVGTGYVGLVTGVCLAEAGNAVVCVDTDESKVAQLNRGALPIYEPGLPALFRRGVKENRLSFTTELAEGVKKADFVFLALPTPPGEDGSADLSYMEAVASSLGPLLRRYTVVVNKSTVPIGTAEKVRARIAKGAKHDFDVVSNPEFLREGYAVEDFMKPDRVVIGSSSERAARLMRDLYTPFVRQGNPIYCMDERSAELAKYAANAFLATKISFMNEIANLAERAGANVDHVRVSMGADSRIGKRFLFPGVGYGGSCFPKDVKALAKTADDHDFEMRIVKAVEAVNEEQKRLFGKRIKDRFGKTLPRKQIAVWGLAFKPDTDDIREAPALALIDLLLREKASITVFDPEALNNARRLLGETVTYASDRYEALQGADALVVATEWAEFRTPDFKRVRRLMKHPVIFDGRNLWEPEAMRSQGFEYHSVGRPPAN